MLSSPEKLISVKIYPYTDLVLFWYTMKWVICKASYSLFDFSASTIFNI